MKINQVELKRYIAPKCEVIALNRESALLANSPDVRPGGGGTGRVTIDPLNPDNGGEDDEIEAP